MIRLQLASGVLEETYDNSGLSAEASYYAAEARRSEEMARHYTVMVRHTSGDSEVLGAYDPFRLPSNSVLADRMREILRGSDIARAESGKTMLCGYELQADYQHEKRRTISRSVNPNISGAKRSICAQLVPNTLG